MDYIIVEKKGKLGIVTLNRPEKRNALSFELVRELKKAINEFCHNTRVKVIILKARGQAFCAGADLGYIRQLQENTLEENLEDSRHLKELFELIYTCEKPVIAEVQGHAIAGGCGLATICDFVFSVPEARFGYTEVKIGFIPALVSVFLSRKIGEGRAREMLLSGQLYSADEAKGMGLINYIVDSEQLNEKTEDFANKLIRDNSGEAMGLTKLLFIENQGKSFSDAMIRMAEMNAKARSTDDCKKGIAAFLNKESISWN